MERTFAGGTGTGGRWWSGESTRTRQKGQAIFPSLLPSVLSFGHLLTKGERTIIKRRVDVRPPVFTR
jgi:hypothetical protein